ncbi:hypothetical protein [Falsiruegeria mediterranea]|uniref:hypothetical protein n=1 Tax=Falsiruegeria mediterranea TaxID=1280832 RepID=UPI0015F24B1C|nr:hypothetical protein [Falsiruegeria mediterranea]
MTKLIDCSIEGVVDCNISQTWTGKLKIALPYGWKSHNYSQEQITEIVTIDEDKYRSAGGAAAGAIIGGVLTGGIGFLAGAALGGRRRKEASFLVRFADGNHAAFTETSGAILKVLDRLLLTAQAQTIAKSGES